MAKDVLKGRSILGRNIFDSVNQSIEEIKHNNPLLEYFKSKGIEFKSSGTNQYLGLCPFHDDHNPSLSVNTEKNIFNCFGCRKSGTIIDAVSLYESIGTGDAIKLLQKKPIENVLKVDFSDDLKIDLKDLNKTIIEEDETIKDNLNNHLLNEIMSKYHKNLFEHKEAIDYLENRGLKSKNNYVRFNMGFCSGNLTEIFSKAQIESLKKLGILRDNGEEFFKDCLVFPITDENENIFGVYGRSINSKAKIKHLYLKGNHKSVFNRKASKVFSDQIILTESIIDAMSLIELGIVNVWSSYGVNGFTDEMLSILKNDNVKEVVIAYDSDDAGRNASIKLKEHLIAENISVRCIFPPVNKDWNEELIKGITKDEILSLIDNSQLFEPKDKKLLNVKKDEYGYIFTIGDIKYQIYGVKENFVNTLKVTIRAEYQDDWFPDNVDLCGSRSRDSFSQKLSQRFNIEPKRVEKDLLNIYDYLEKEQRKKIENIDKSNVIELTDEEIIIGTKFLKSPDLFEQIVNDMNVIGYVGEDLNKMLVYLSASSRIMDDPISVLILSQSASGKSMLVETLRKLLPQEDVIAITSLSDQALNYIGDLLHKFLIFGEAIHSETIEHQIREMLSNKELSRLVTVKDVKTGMMKSEIVRKDVIVSSVMSSTNPRLNPENLSRFFVINADESKEQTKRIHLMQRKKYSLERINEKKEYIPEIIRKHQAAQRLLKKYHIVNPFASYLNFPDNLMRTRRDHDRFIDLIACVCFLRQYQKDIKNNGSFNYLECDLIDYEISRNICVNSILSATLSEFPKSLLDFYEELRIISKDLAKNTNLNVIDVSFDFKEIRSRIKSIGIETTRKYLRTLVNNEYIQIFSGGIRGQRKKYKLVNDEPMEQIDISMIPTVEEIKKLIRS